MGADSVEENDAFITLGPAPSFIQNLSGTSLVRDYLQCLHVPLRVDLTRTDHILLSAYLLLRVASNFLMTGPKVNAKYSINDIITLTN